MTLAVEPGGEGAYLRSFNLVARLIHIGVLPMEASRPPFTHRQRGAFWDAMKQAKVDAYQLERGDDDYVTASVDLAKIAHLDPDLVRASLKPVLANQVQVLSANTSWQAFINCKGFSYESNGLKHPDGSHHGLTLDPVTGGPSFIRDPVAWAKSLSKLSGADVTVIPGSHLMDAWVMATLGSYNVSYTLAEGIKLAAIAGGSRYNGPLGGVCSSKTREIIGMLPAVSKLVRAPVSLMGKSSLPVLLSYYFDWMMHDSTYKVFFERHPGSRSFTYDALVRPRISVATDPWKHYSSVREYFMDAANGKPGVPCSGIAQACKDLELRRNDENKNPALTSLLDTATSNLRCPEARGADGVGQYGTVVTFLREVDVPVPSHIHVTGVGTGPMIPKISAWAPGATISTFDQVRASTNTLPFTEWNVFTGYPGSAPLLIDASYCGQVKDVELANATKTPKLLDARYETVVVRYYLTSNVCKDMTVSKRGISLPYHLERVASAYRTVRLLAPGRAHTSEVFFCGHGFLGEGAVPSNVSLVARSLYYKAALMTVANAFRSACFTGGIRAAFSDNWPRDTNSPFWKEIFDNLGFGTYASMHLYDITKLISGRGEATIPSGLDMDIVTDLFDLPPSELDLVERGDSAIASAMLKASKLHERDLGDAGHAAALLEGMEAYVSPVPPADRMQEEEEEESPSAKGSKRRRPASDDKEKFP
jgi:hypothetical protein